MLSEAEIEEVCEIRARHTRMQIFRLSVILVYSLGLIPLAALTILSAEVWRGEINEMMPGLVLFFGSFAFFAGVILIQSDQYMRDKARLERLERMHGDELPWECPSSILPDAEVVGFDKTEEKEAA